MTVAEKRKLSRPDLTVGELAERIDSVVRVLYEESSDCSQGAPQYPSFMAHWLSEQASYLEAIADRLREIAK